MENKEKQPLRVTFADWTPVIIPIEQIKLRKYYFALMQFNWGYSRYWVYVTKIEKDKIFGYGVVISVAENMTSSQRDRDTGIVETEIDLNSEDLYGFDYLTNEAAEEIHELHLRRGALLNNECKELEKANFELYRNQRDIDDLQIEIEKLKAKLGYTKPSNLLALGGFKDCYLQEISDYIVEEFSHSPKSASEVRSLLQDKELLIAFISDDDDYFEAAFFLLKDTEGNLYEVHASHCSCMGFEGQFELEPTNLTALKFRIDNGDGLDSHIKEEDKEKVKHYIISL